LIFLGAADSSSYFVTPW